ncbi:hypothetical protein Rhopal_003951-T1 [Rhodotorula paludigena]|uniref:Calcium-dependent phosphotriesterase n=1 Tax=Rhodotorula paludigena TaxID=86838 RepID=A0AAV5GPJ3_9BASI|nr:hypothetical protein Rhopal_003951-T1 [Rhodotorula paludigena]
MRDELAGLEACEDAEWVDQESGLAYLVCSSREARKHWVPATLHLNSSLLPPISTDYIALFDLNTRSYRRLELHGLPAESNGVWVHGIALWRDVVDPSKLTLFVNSHRPPKDRSLGPVQGADSVIEIFETTVGSHEARHVKTVKHDLIRTPNNMVATGPRTFYASNDHRYKVHWSRLYEKYASVASDIVYCDASRTAASCLVAADKVVYPNGVTKGAGNLLYQATSLEGLVRIWEMQPDHTLKVFDEIKLNRHCDNIHVGGDGSIYVTALTKIFDFTAAGKDGGLGGHQVPVEIFRIRNDTSAPSSDGRQYRVELAFADTGKIVSASTTGAPYQDKLLLTGKLELPPVSRFSNDI